MLSVVIQKQSICGCLVEVCWHTVINHSNWLQKQRQAEESSKKAEVEALQQQIAQMKALQSNMPGKKAPGNKVAN